MINKIVYKDLKEERLDKYLSREVNISRSRIEVMIKEGYITVNEKIVKKNYLLSTDDEILISEILEELENIIPLKMDLDIVYEDEYLIIINKPRGLVVHPAPGHKNDTLVNGLLYRYKELSKLNGDFRPGIVHRIDKDTSGIIVVAKNDEIHKKLGEEFKKHNIRREYTALVSGIIEEKSGEIILPIARDKVNRKKMTVDRDGKEAKTTYEVIERFKTHTLVNCVLDTGRTHQIRVHLAYIKHPVAGDPVYGYKSKIVPQVGQYLHARVLGFDHPKSGEYMEFTSELPDYFIKVLEELRINNG